MKSGQNNLRLEDSTIWQEACSLAEYMYSKLIEFSEEEKWDSQRKLRSSANDVMFFVSQAIGNAVPGGREYEWGLSRKHAAALKTMYRFACRQKFIDLEPEIMVRLDKLIKQIDLEVVKANRQTEEHGQKELELWLEKYRLWQKISKEK